MANGRLWTDADIETLRVMVATGAGYRDLSAALNRTRGSCAKMLRKMGLRIDPQAALARRIAASKDRAGRSRKCPGPMPLEHRRRISEGVCRAYSERPDLRAMRSEQMRRLRATPEGRAMSISAGIASGTARMAWCPPHLREEYRFLTRNKGIRAADARGMLAPKIEAFRQTFEGKLWLLATGKAVIVPNIKPQRQPTHVFGQGAMS